MFKKVAGLQSAVGRAPYCRSMGRKLNPSFGHITIVEYFLWPFPPLPLIQEGQYLLLAMYVHLVLIHHSGGLSPPCKHLPKCKKADYLVPHDHNRLTGP